MVMMGFLVGVSKSQKESEGVKFCWVASGSRETPAPPDWMIWQSSSRSWQCWCWSSHQCSYVVSTRIYHFDPLPTRQPNSSNSMSTTQKSKTSLSVNAIRELENQEPLMQCLLLLRSWETKTLWMLVLMRSFLKSNDHPMPPWWLTSWKQFIWPTSKIPPLPPNCFETFDSMNVMNLVRKMWLVLSLLIIKKRVPPQSRSNIHWGKES